MDRYEMEELLRNRAEDYEELYASAQQYMEECREELKERFLYAELLEKPVNKKQILFWNGNKGNFAGVPRALFDCIYERFGQEFTYVWVLKASECDNPELPKDVVCIRKNSPEYWNALAVSGYLIGDGNLPVPYVKRQGQIYFNVFRKQKACSLDESYLYVKELYKTDFLLIKETMKHIPERDYRFCGLYEGTLLETGNTKIIERETAEKLTDRIFGQKIPTVSGEKKKVLFFVNWKEEREHRSFLRALINAAARENYDVTVAVPRMNSELLEAEFEALSPEVRKIIYRGRFTVTEQDLFLLKLLEKHPEIYAKEAEVRSFVDALMENEWRRIWGNVKFDCVVLSGRMTLPQYYMAGGLKSAKKVLVDLDFLMYLKGRAEDAWRSALTVFDRIYTLPGEAETGCYGEENKERTELLPLFPETEEPAEIVKLQGEKYLISDQWKNEDGRLHMKLVKMPVKGKLSPDDYIRSYLPYLPAGKAFFQELAEKFEDSEIQDEALLQICRAYRK